MTFGPVKGTGGNLPMLFSMGWMVLLMPVGGMKGGGEGGGEEECVLWLVVEWFG